MFTMPVPTAPLSLISQLSVKQIFAKAALGGNSSDHEIVKKLSPPVLNAEAVFAHSLTSDIPIPLGGYARDRNCSQGERFSATNGVTLSWVECHNSTTFVLFSEKSPRSI